MARPRRIVDAGPFTIDLRNLEYMERVYKLDEYGSRVHGIRFVFYSGAHRTAWYGWKENTREAWYSDFMRELQKFHG